MLTTKKERTQKQIGRHMDKRTDRQTNQHPECDTSSWEHFVNILKKEPVIANVSELLMKTRE